MLDSLKHFNLMKKKGIFPISKHILESVYVPGHNIVVLRSIHMKFEFNWPSGFREV